jgi:hypothetical protein
LLATTIDSSLFFDRALGISGRTLETLFELRRPDVPWISSVAALGDLDGDQRSDWILGTGRYVPSVVARSSASASFLYAVNAAPGAEPGGRLDPFGSDVAAIGDVDGDGRADFAVTGCVDDDDVARICIFSGSDGRQMRTVRVARLGKPYESLSIEPIGDTDADGIPELLAYSARSDTQRALHCVELDGSEVRVLATFQRLILRATPIGDRNGDGVADVAVLAGSKAPGHLVVLDGASASVLAAVPCPSVQGSDAWRFYDELQLVGDVDGDGSGEIAAQLQLGERHFEGYELGMCLLSLAPRDGR